ncbi:membrane metalloprotease [Seonamhaeicola sp. ML3]|uniref:membrane metalloprotease n=1 Tax=Seonamhaeicola sp. ML3 TaxID=2937786 RepID=UPI00200D0AB4|nr:membrane metalloprotease [Seonamhaeicola sp. ML3]
MKYTYYLTSLILLLLLGCSTENNNQEQANDNEDNTPNTIGNKAGTGTSSKDLLSDDVFTSMIVELVYVEGYEPTQKAINNFKSFMEVRVHKPNGITIEKKAIPSPGKDRYSTQDIITIEDDNRTKFNNSNTIAVWAFFVDGESDRKSNSSVVLGTAYRNTSFVIFEKTIQGLSDNPLEPNRSVLETTVITHEVGHILGLTDLGADMVQNHEDDTHAKHCNVESCLMYWSAETGDGLSNLIGTSAAPQLDAHCIADLQANGGK